MRGKGGGKAAAEKEIAEKGTEENEDFLQVCHDDSKFGGKSISSPVKSIEVLTVL